MANLIIVFVGADGENASLIAAGDNRLELRLTKITKK
jgi:hypothetical protein